MNHSLFLTVNKPNIDNDEYNNFVKILKDIGKQNTNLRILTENSLLLPLTGPLNTLLEILKILRNLPYVYAILPEDTKWYEGKNII